MSVTVYAWVGDEGIEDEGQRIEFCAGMGRRDWLELLRQRGRRIFAKRR
jgi:hypothetical protein